MRRVATKFLLFTLIVCCSLAGNTNASAASEQQTTSKRFLGAAISTEHMKSSRLDPFGLSDPYGYTSTFTNRFNSLTPENAMKMDVLWPNLKKRNFEKADRLVRLAKSLGKRVRGHALIFGKQDPGFIQSFGKICEKLKPFGAKNTRLSLLQNRMKVFLQTHITSVINRYQSDIQQWDVVNEAFEDNGSFHQNAWFKCLGPSYVEMAFRAARAADKSAQLFYNEYNAELPGPRRLSTYLLVQRLRKLNLIDGIGFQTHVWHTFASRITEFGQTLDAFAALGLDIELTELDVGLPPGGGTAEEQAAQTLTYATITHACATRQACNGITVWGVSDRESWHRDESPLPIDFNHQPKLSYFMLQKGLLG